MLLLRTGQMQQIVWGGEQTSLSVLGVRTSAGLGIGIFISLGVQTIRFSLSTNFVHGVQH